MIQEIVKNIFRRLPTSTRAITKGDRLADLYFRECFRRGLHSAGVFIKERMFIGRKRQISRRFISEDARKLSPGAPENRSHSANWLNSVTTPTYGPIYIAHKEFVAPPLTMPDHNRGYYFNRILPRERGAGKGAQPIARHSPTRFRYLNH